MNRLAWRIVKAAFVAGAFDGEGARRFGGRWNSPGIPMVYTASSKALAALEMLVHLQSGDLLKHYRVIPVAFDESVLRALDEQSLPKNWLHRISITRGIGDDWIKSHRSVVLQVPNRIVPGESNYLLNPLHQDYRKMTFGPGQTFRFDRRLK